MSASHTKKRKKALVSEANVNFGALSYFKLGELLEGLRPLMSYRWALRVLVTFTEQVVPIQKHNALFWIPSMSGTKTATMKLTKRAAVKLSEHTHPLHIYWVPHWPCVIWKIDSGDFFHTLYVTITNYQRHKKRMLIVIHYNFSRSFLYRDFLLGT